MKKISKISDARQFHGRGSDNVRASARYSVAEDGQTIAKLFASPTRYMERPNWKVLWLDPAGEIVASRDLIPSFKAAKEIALGEIRFCDRHASAKEIK
jgi:hypothetical protein